MYSCSVSCSVDIFYLRTEILMYFRVTQSPLKITTFSHNLSSTCNNQIYEQKILLWRKKSEKSFQIYLDPEVVFHKNDVNYVSSLRHIRKNIRYYNVCFSGCDAGYYVSRPVRNSFITTDQILRFSVICESERIYLWVYQVESRTFHVPN
jgi:hypothetical protein